LQNYQECTTYSETAWGAGDRFVEQGNWATYITYTVECEEPTPPQQCTTDTAFGGNTPGGGSAWWYYFDPSKGSTQTIWAGQSKEAGDVTVSGCSDGKVTITITLTDGWELQDVKEPVKIQGYSKLPNKRPSAGQFTAYKGKDLSDITVDCSKYYVIQLDVKYCK